MAKPITLSADRDPWERQNGESARQYGRYIVFRDLGESRTLNDALEIINATSTTKLAKGSLHQLSFIYRWTERCESWDAKQAQAEQQRLIRLRRDMIERHRRIATGLTGKALTAMNKLSNDSPGLAPVDIVRFITLAADLERKALGEPTERIAVSGPAGGPVQVEDLTRLTAEQRKARLGQIASELARRAGRELVTGDDEDGVLDG
jgi:hypothetical protein